MHKKDCANCRKTFTHVNPLSIYCSSTCSNEGKVKRRYERENNDWHAYFKHLLSKKKDSSLTIQQLLNMLDRQNHRCALSGVELTCIRRRGTTILTNASIDRIKAGGAYNSRNVQLVCRAINSFRSTLPIPEYLEWCRKVVAHNKVK